MQLCVAMEAVVLLRNLVTVTGTLTNAVFDYLKPCLMAHFI